MSDLRDSYGTWRDPRKRMEHRGSHYDLAIETSGLVKAFGETRAVDEIDLTVQRGAVYGVLGPNGAGKTTVVRMLATLLQPDSSATGSKELIIMSQNSEGVFEKWRRRRAARRVKSGDGRPLKRFCWWISWEESS